MKQEKYPTNVSLIKYFLRGSIRYFIIAIIFAMFVSLFELVSPKIIGFMVDSILGNEKVNAPFYIQFVLNRIGGVEALKQNLLLLAGIVIFVYMLSAASRYIFRISNVKGAETLVQTMRDDLFDHILHLPFSWHSENHTGDIIQRCTSDVEQIKVFLSEQLTMLFRVVVLIVLALIFMAQVSLKLTLVAIIFIPMIIGYSYFFHHRIGSQFEKVDIEEGNLSAIAQENLTGVRVVRAFGREAYEKERFEQQNKYYTNMWVRLLNLLAAFWSTSDIFSQLQILSVMTFGAVLCVNGEITAGNYIAFVYYNALLKWPIRMIGRVIANMSKAGISIERLRYIMNSEEEKDAPDAMEPKMDEDIIFDHVSFTYENGNTEILKDINLKIEKGKTVGILGATGSGKSTLMYLLDRLYDIPENSGKITIGGIDIKKIKRSWLRENIGMVLQEPYLFSRSLEENIRIANSSANQFDVKDVASIAALDETISHFKQGYDTFVGERGVTLSGGQKQRAAIAQMLIKKPPIMVFDDSLSAVDSETDAKIRRALKEKVEDSTVILIAHRITTIMHADVIVVMDKGKIIELGSHDELIKKKGIYCQIHDLQLEQGLLDGEVEYARA